MIIKYISKAWKGRKEWLRLRKAHDLSSKSTIIILPEDNLDFNKSAIEQTPRYMEKHYYDSAALLLCDYGKKYDIAKLGPKVNALYLPKNRIDVLLSYYRFIGFHRAIRVISFKDPYGCDGLLKVDGVDLDYMVLNYIFG